MSECERFCLWAFQQHLQHGQSDLPSLHETLAGQLQECLKTIRCRYYHEFWPSVVQSRFRITGVRTSGFKSNKMNQIFSPGRCPKGDWLWEQSISYVLTYNIVWSQFLSKVSFIKDHNVSKMWANIAKVSDAIYYLLQFKLIADELFHPHHWLQDSSSSRIWCEPSTDSPLCVKCSKSSRGAE